MPTKKQLAAAQAIYMSYLMEAAKDDIQDNKPLAFDPQGRVLVDIELNDRDYSDIVAQINDELDLDKDYVETIEGLKKALGRQITPVTTVSLDIRDHEAVLTFNVKLEAALKKAGVNAPKPILAALYGQPSGSIIALQQEFHFHMGLALRVCQKASAQFKGKEVALMEAHQATMLQVNQLVIAAFAAALKKATTPEAPPSQKLKLDISLLNTELDKARASITPKAHQFLKKEIVKRTGVVLTPAELGKLKHLAESTTATPNDVLHTSAHLGLATFIAGSESTAHDRKIGSAFAHRQLITHQYTPDRIIANQNTRLQIRTPSLDVKKGITSGECIDDIASNKLPHIKATYGLATRLRKVDDNVGIPAAFVYNLHTALNNWVDGSNKQNQGAANILFASHQYNAEQLEQENEEPVYCFVQNISVNGFGDALGYDSENAARNAFGYDSNLVQEATLMTDMSLLHTLYGSVKDAAIQGLIKNVMGQYEGFLLTPNQTGYFSQSAEGKEAIRLITTQIKPKLKKEVVDPDTDDVQVLAKAALKQLIANNLHFSHTHAKLVQALSVFVADVSISGCKSGNERAQAVNGRVTILDTALNSLQALGDKGDALIDALKAMGAGDDASASADDLKAALDSIYNEQGLQTAASVVSLVDQGASAKVEATGGVFAYFNTNNAEESYKVMSNLQQSNSGAMQAHKGLPKQMKKAWAKPAVAANDAEVQADHEAPAPDVAPDPDVIKKRLIAQIGRYGGAPGFEASSKLSPEGLEALYKPIKLNKYKGEQSADP